MLVLVIRVDLFLRLFGCVTIHMRFRYVDGFPLCSFLPVCFMPKEITEQEEFLCCLFILFEGSGQSTK